MAALAFLLLAMPTLGVAAVAASALLITAIGRNPFDPRTYFRLCPVAIDGACIAMSGWQALAIGAVALVIGAGLLIAGVHLWRSAARVAPSP